MPRVELTRREREVAALVGEGLTNREIAKRLFISERTAEFHVEQIRDKLGFRSRVEIAGWVTRDHDMAARTLGNLSPELTSFIGRERDIERVTRLVTENRMVTLVGSPGIGKTRLARQVADVLANRHRGGTWMIDLAPLTNTDELVRALADTFGLRERPDEPLTTILLTHLRRRDALVVLDNCEHVLGAAAQVAELLLRECPSLRIVATSQQSIRSAGEIVYRVPPLAEADRLFCDRASQAMPGFEWTPAVNAICKRLDSVPLAIELAAARVGVMPIDDLAAGLDRSLSMLTTGVRTAARRQQSLRAALDWSHDLLSPAQRIVFARLSVFVGGFTLEAAGAVCGADAGDSVELVLGLVEKSLVSRMPTNVAPARYRMLEFVRQYAAEHFDHLGADEPTYRLHFDYYLRWMEAHAAMLDVRPQHEVLDLLDAEMPNVRAALTWSRQHEPDGHLRLALAACEYWAVRGSKVESKSWLESGLAGSTDRGKARADGLWRLAIIAAECGDRAASAALNREAMDLYGRLGDWAQLARVLNNLAWVIDDPDAQDRLLEESLDNARRSGDLAVVGLVLASQGRRLRDTGRPEAARELLEQSLALRRRAGREWTIIRSLIALGHVSLDLDDPNRAASYLMEALETARRLGDTAGLADVLDAFARGSADAVRALKLAAASRALRAEVGSRPFFMGTWDVSQRLSSARAELQDLSESVESEGAAMSVDEMVSEALAVSPAPDTEEPQNPVVENQYQAP